VVKEAIIELEAQAGELEVSGFGWRAPAPSPNLAHGSGAMPTSRAIGPRRWVGKLAAADPADQEEPE
jgi:hypothetical protein